jgi:hypothetical protein
VTGNLSLHPASLMIRHGWPDHDDGWSDWPLGFGLALALALAISLAIAFVAGLAVLWWLV